jgi:hypothetical protein
MTERAVGHRRRERGSHAGRGGGRLTGGREPEGGPAEGNWKAGWRKGTGPGGIAGETREEGRLEEGWRHRWHE